ncbi:MAG TPA: SDR family NAD(P)-dependent oxidoreductase [Kineosporiaceae bacterium]
MSEPGTVLVTGPTRNLGRHAVLAMAGRPDGQRPDLLLVGRAGRDLTAVADEARDLGARVHEIGCDLASLADVGSAAANARGLFADGAVHPLRALVANAGIMSADTRRASADGYELTFAVNHLAHAQLIGDLLVSFTAPARVVLVGSNTYHANFWRTLLHVPAAEWADPVELARPASGEQTPGMQACGVAYSNAKLAILTTPTSCSVRPARGSTCPCSSRGWMPGTALGRGVPGDRSRPGPDSRRLDAAALGAADGLDGPRRPVGAPA